MEFLKELFSYFRKRKKIWLLPILIVTLFFGILIIYSEGTVIAPFIYTIF